MKIDLSLHLESIQKLQRNLKKEDAPAQLITHLDALTSGLDRSRVKERTVATRVLRELDMYVEYSGLDAPTTQLLHARIHELQAAVLQKTVKRTKEPIPARLAIFLGDDHNGSMASSVRKCCQEQVPFICSASILSGSDLEEMSAQTQHLDQLKSTLKSGWKFYQQIDKELGEQFVVCIPEPYNIKDFDLVPSSESGSVLTEVSKEDILNGPHDPYSFEALKKLLSGRGDHNKLITINAHGSVGQPLGLTPEELRNLLDLLKAHRCKAAAINSCYSGGESTQLILENAPPFPVIARSIGDYPSYSAQIDSSLRPFFKELESILREPGGDTTDSFRKAIMKAEEGRNKSVTNSMQVYFPQSPSPLQGFRALSESLSNFSLTFAKLRGAEISHPPTSLALNHVMYLAIYPSIIDITLSITGFAPSLLSMIGGKAQHHINTIEMKDSSFSAFILAQKDFYSSSINANNQIGVSKVFFINKLICIDGTYEKVVVFCKESTPPKILYKNANRFYLDEDTVKSITPFRYAVEASRAFELTKPSPEALKQATAGQQSIQDLSTTWVAHPFEGDLSPCNPDRLSAMTLAQASHIIRQLSNTNKSHMIYHLHANGRSDLVEKLIRRGNIPLDTVFPSGNTLLHNSIMAGEKELFDYLLTQSIDINAAGADNNTPLHMALQLKHQDFAQKLLASPHIDLSKRNGSGMTPLFYGEWLPEMWGALLQKRHSSDDLSSIMASYCGWTNPPLESIEVLLKAGADPNEGTPTPFASALKSGNTALMETLLKYGAKPFEQNKQGICPMIEALRNTPRSVLMQFLNHSHIQELLRNSQNALTHLIQTAQNRGDPKLVARLMEFSNESAS